MKEHKVMIPLKIMVLCIVFSSTYYVSSIYQTRNRIPLGLSKNYLEYERDAGISLNFDTLQKAFPELNVLLVTYDQINDISVYDPEYVLYDNVFVTVIGQRRYFSKSDYDTKKNIGMVVSGEIETTLAMHDASAVELGQIINTFHSESELGIAGVHTIRNLAYTNQFKQTLIIDSIDHPKSLSSINAYLLKSGYRRVRIDGVGLTEILTHFAQDNLNRNSVHVLNGCISVIIIYMVATVYDRLSRFRAYSISRICGATHSQLIFRDMRYQWIPYLITCIVLLVLFGVDRMKMILLVQSLVSVSVSVLISKLIGFKLLKRKYRDIYE